MWKPLVCRLENDQKISTFLHLPGISTRWPGRGFSTSAMAGKSKDWKLLEAWRMLLAHHGRMEHPSSPWWPLTLHVEPASMEIQHDTPGKRTHTHIYIYTYIYIYERLRIVCIVITWATPYHNIIMYHCIKLPAALILRILARWPPDSIRYRSETS